MSGAALTPADLDAIEARANAATPGPWRRAPSLGIDSEVRAGQHDALTLCAEVHAFPGGGDPRTDADFIASSRADVPRLVAALRAAEPVDRRARRVPRAGAGELRRGGAAAHPARPVGQQGRPAMSAPIRDPWAFRKLVRALRTESYKQTPLWQLQERAREKAAAEPAESAPPPEEPPR